MGLAVLLVAATLSTGTFDRTASCATTAAPAIFLQAHSAFTIGAASTNPVPVPAAATLSGGDASNPNRVAFGGVSAIEHGYGFAAGACSKQVAPIPLSAAGLRLRGTFTPGDAGVGVMNDAVVCALRARVVVRIRARIGSGDAPTSGFVAVRSGAKTLRPLLYVAWTPARVRVFAARTCSG